MLANRIKSRLEVQKKTGLYRNPLKISHRHGKYIYTEHGKLLNFASNDYLGLGASPILRQKIAANFKKWGASSSSSRLVSANFNVITDAEKAYADYFGYESALFYPSGYQANLGLITALFTKGDTLIFDKHVHASTVKGMQLSGASFLGYKHNNMAHLEKRLEKNKATAVITEALFSMDGDFLDLQSFGDLQKKYGFFTIIDQAHAFGVVGLQGRGFAIDGIAVGTMGKALGFWGAVVLLPDDFREYLLNFSAPLIYTTALPEAHAVSALDILELIQKSDEQRKTLIHLSELIRTQLADYGFKTRGDAHIIALEIGDENLAVRLTRKMLTKGFFVFPARFPTVPLGRAILRISLTALHNQNDLKALTLGLKESYKEFT